MNSNTEANVSVNPAAIVIGTDLSVTQVATPSPVSVGSPLTFIVTVKNLGSVSASSVVLTETAPVGAVITTSQGTVSGNVVSLGTIAAGQLATVSVSVTAPCGTIANSAVVSSTTPDPVSANNSVTASVVPMDATPPSLTLTFPANAPANAPANGSCQAAVPAIAYSSADNCGPVIVAQSPAAGTMVGLGPNMIAVTATDAAGNATTQTTTFTVVDTTPPVLLCPADMVVGSNDGCTYVGSIGSATAVDNCDPNVQITSDAPSSFPLGVTVITWTARDSAGLTTTAAQRVTVIDRTPPTFAGLPSTPIIAFAAPTQCGARVDLTGVTAVDNCSATVVGVRSDGQSLSADYPLGTTRVTFTATDASGNTVGAELDVVVLPLNLAWPVATATLATVSAIGADLSFPPESSAGHDFNHAPVGQTFTAVASHVYGALFLADETSFTQWLSTVYPGQIVPGSYPYAVAPSVTVRVDLFAGEGISGPVLHSTTRTLTAPFFGFVDVDYGGAGVVLIVGAPYTLLLTDVSGQHVDRVFEL